MLQCPVTRNRGSVIGIDLAIHPREPADRLTEEEDVASSIIQSVVVDVAPLTFVQNQRGVSNRARPSTSNQPIAQFQFFVVAEESFVEVSVPLERSQSNQHARSVYCGRSADA